MVKQPRKRAVRALFVLVAATALSLTLATSAQAVHLGTLLERGDQMNREDYIERNLGATFNYQRVRLVMQGDGNLVLYALAKSNMTGKTCWASNTVGRGTRAVYQHDGNFVVYNVNTPTWASNTVGDGGSTVDINWLGKLYVGFKQITGECHGNPI